MAENIRPTPSALEYQREGQDRSYAFISESEIGPGLFLGNTKTAENIPPTPSALDQRGSQSRSYATMLEIKPDLLNAKKAENIHPAPSALEYYKKTQIRSYPPMPKYKVTTSRPKKAENRPLPSTLEVQKKNMSRTYPSMSEIEPGLFLGNCKSCYNRPLLEANDINAIVSLTNTDPGAWATTREYVSEDRHKWLLCQDSSTQDLLIHMDHICEFIDHMLQSESPGAVLVHCEFGVSRSPTIVIAYLMRKRGLKFEDALAMVKEKRKVRPSANFVKQLQIWEQVGYEIWEDSEAKVPKAAYQAYLNERAAILMAKGLTGDEPIEPVLPEILRPKPRV